MRKSVLLVCIALVTLCVNTASAMAGAGIYIRNIGKSQLWRFDATASTGTMLGTYKASYTPTPDDLTVVKVSPDGKWMAIGWITHSGVLQLELGRVGEALTSLKVQGDETLNMPDSFGF